MEEDNNSASAIKLANSHDLISEIFSKLPIKTFVRFKLVSKHWQSLLNSHCLRHLHAQNSLHSHSNLILILKSAGSELSIEFVDKLDIDFGVERRASRHIFALKPLSQVHQVVGSCNGLVCTVVFDHFISLSNPLTRVTRALPKLEDKRFMFDDDNHWVSFGFGQDVVTKDYKLLRIDQINGARGATTITEVHILSLRSGNWRSLGKFPGLLENPSNHGQLANGALHWLFLRDKKIVSFDLNTEKYSFIDLPLYVDKTDRRISIGVIGDFLYFQVNYKLNFFKWVAVVWWLMDHRVENSWFKLFEYEYEHLSEGTIFTIVRPLAFCRGEGKVLLLKFRRLGKTLSSTTYVWYDLKNGSEDYIYMSGCRFEYEKYKTEMVCVGSLVCPYRATMLCSK